MASEVPNRFRSIILSPVETDTVPVPGDGEIVLSADDDNNGTLSIRTNAGDMSVSPTGVSTPSGVVITATTFTIPAASATFTMTQTAAPVDTAGASLTIKSQAGGAKSKTADGAGGDVVIQTGAGGGSAAAGTFTVKVGATTMLAADATKITLPNGLTWTQSDATPENAVAAPVGSLHTDKTGGVLYLKKTGTGNTGWKAVTTAV